MHDALALRYQPVADMPAVAVARVGLRAHDANAAHLSGGDHGPGGLLEFRRLHMGEISVWPHAAKRAAVPVVGDAGRGERARERLASEVRMAARSRVRAHVHQELD